jgi:hypothetical protein
MAFSEQTAQTKQSAQIKQVVQTGQADWSRLSPEDRVLVCLGLVADGTTATAAEICGLGEDVICQIEEDQPAPLATAYRCFLQHAGGGAGRFLQGSDVFHPEILGLRTAAEELIGLESTDRVILMHQGCQFDFLRGSGPDPEVWTYSEGSAPERHYAHFTDWLKANAEEQTKAWAHLAGWCDL